MTGKQFNDGLALMVVDLLEKVPIGGARWFSLIWFLKLKRTG